MEPLAGLIEQLEQGGRFDSRGEFTLDREKAREKLRKYQLVDPRAYLLELVQAAVLKGATRIEFAIDTDDMRMGFDGEPFTHGDYEELYPSIFSADSAPSVRARRYLALGLNGALGTHPRFVRLASAGPRDLLLVEMRPGRADEAQVTSGSGAGTRIHVRDRLRPGLLVEMLRHLASDTHRERLIRQRCRFCRVPVFVGGSLVSSGLRLPDRHAAVAIEDQGVSGLAGFDLALSKAAEVHFLSNGVLLSTELLELGPLRFTAVVEGRELKTNIAESSVVKDEAYDRAMTAVLAARERAVAKICGELLEPGDGGLAHESLLRQALRREVLQFVTIEPFRAADRESFPAVLARPKLWRDATGGDRRVSLEELLDLLDAGGEVHYSTRSFEELNDGGQRPPVVLLSSREERRLFRRLFGTPATNVTDRLGRELEQEQNRRLWLSRPHRPTLGDGLYLARLPIDEPGVNGEVGIKDLSRVTTSFSWLKDGFLLHRVDERLPVPGFEAAVEADFRPTAGYDGVWRDSALAAGVVAVARAVPALFAAAAARMGPAQRAEPATQAAFRELLAFLADQDYPAVFLERLGFTSTSADRYVRAAAEKRPFPAPDLGPRGAGPLASVACFRTLGGDPLAISDLHRVESRIGYVSASALGALAPSDRRGAAAASTHEKALPGASTILVLEEEDRETLERILGPERLEDRSDDLLFATHRALHLAKPREPLHLTGLLVAETILAGDLSGEIGLPDPSRHRADESDPATDRARIRLLRERRFLAELVLPMPFGPLAAIINCDTVRPTPNWRDVEDAECLERIRSTLVAALPNLLHSLGAAMPRLQPRSREAMRRRMLTVVSRLAARPGRLEEDDPIVAALRSLPLFPALGGGASSLKIIQARLSASGSIEIARDEPRFRGMELPSDSLLLYGNDEDKILGGIFGRRHLVDRTADLESLLRQQALETRSPVRSLALAPGDALVALRIDARGVTGEVGLARHHPGERAASTLRLCKHQRQVAVVKLEIGPCLTALVNDDSLVLDESLSCDQGDPSFQRLLSVILEQVPPLLERLVDAWEGLGRGDRQTAWSHVLDFLARECRSSATGALAPTSDTVGRLAALAGFRGADGNAYCLVDLAQAYRRWGEIRTIASLLPGPFEHPGDLVIVASWLEKARLPVIFPIVVDYTEEWREILQSRRNRAAAAAVPEPTSLPILVREDLKGEQVEGFLYLPTHRTFDRRVLLAREGRVIRRRQISETCPCLGVAWGRGIEANRSWTGVNLSARAKQELEEGARRLYGSLARLYARKADDPDWPAEVAASYLLEVAKRLHQELPARREGETELRRLYQELAGLRLIPLDTGQRVTLRRALEERPRSLLHLRLWDDREARPGSLPASGGSAARPEEQSAAPQPAAARGRDRDSAPPRQPSPPQRVAEAAAAGFGDGVAGRRTRADDGKKAEASLLEALRAELRWIQEKKVRLLSPLELDRLRFVEGSPDAIASCTDRGVRLHRRNPLVQTALAGWTDDPVLISLLASAAFTALNHHRADVTDADERRFHFLLADFMASRSQPP